MKLSFIKFFIVVFSLSALSCNVSNGGNNNLFSFIDNTGKPDTLRIQQSISEFIDLTEYSDSVSIRRAASQLLSLARKDSIAYQPVINIVEDSLFTPGSPVYSEELFIVFLEEMVANPFPNENAATTIRAQMMLEDLNKNKRGTIASDFTFTTREGKNMNLHSLPSDKDVLLIFYDPECNVCQQELNEIANDTRINEKIKAGTLMVAAINSGGDEELWHHHSTILPESWVVGYEDGKIDYDEMYVFFTSPAIYLLDKNKTVIAKDIVYPKDFKSVFER